LDLFNDFVRLGEALAAAKGPNRNESMIGLLVSNLSSTIDDMKIILRMQ
jgi:hypothetical protein